MNQYKKLTADTIIFAISNFSSKLLIFFLLPLYTNYLQTVEYGTVDLLNNMITILFPVCSLSLIEGILRFSFDEGVKRCDILIISLFSVSCSVGILCLLTPVVFLLGGLIRNYWPHFLLIYSGYSLTTTLSYYFRGINAVKYVAIQGILQTFIMVIGNVVALAVLYKGVKGYIVALASSYYMTSFIMIIGTKTYREIKRAQLNITLLKDMLKYCVPMIPGKIAWWMNNSLDKYFIIGFRGLDISGLYGVAHKIPSILTVATEIFNQAWQISAIEIYSNNDSNRDIYSKVHQYYIYFSVVCASGLILFAKFLGKILFANEYFIAWKFVPPLIVAAVFASLSGYYHSIFRAAKMPKELCLTVICGTIVNLFLNVFFVPGFGGMGAAYATLASFFAEWLISYIYVKRVIHLKVNIYKVLILYMLLLLEATITVFDIEKCFLVDGIVILVMFVLIYREAAEIVNKIRREIRLWIK